MAKDSPETTSTETASEAPAGRQSPVYQMVSLDKRDTSGTGIASNALEPEDEFHNRYLGQKDSIHAIKPPYNLTVLDRLSQENNALNPCIEAMVTNVAGTGFALMKIAPGAEKEDGKSTDPKVSEMWEFFDEPWPGESFLSQRKKVRRDTHRTGNGYLEVIRNMAEEIIFTRHTDAKMMRLIKLDGPRNEQVTVKRRGKEVSMSMQKRYRRFVQMVNGKNFRYFKEFGCPLDLDKTTGEFAPKGTRLGAQKRATEIIHFTDMPDAHTPYGVPRWISQLPSVLGSRKAEEFNLEFFNNGGVPPVLIILQGGVLAGESRRALETKVGGDAKSKQRVQVLEMEPSGGSIDKPGTTRVTVERFGSERQNDSMFEKYDEKCEIRIRRAFRLPPMFVGQAADYSFASAYASYTVAEAQVFAPEREEFDEIMTVLFIPALGYDGYRMKSHPMTITDSTIKLNGLTLAAETGFVSATEIVDAVNETTGTALTVEKTPQKIEYLHSPKVSPSLNTGAKQGVPGAPKAKQKPLTNQGTPQSNSTKPTPKSTPTKSPAVTKDDGGAERLFHQLLKGATEGGADLDALVQEIREMDEETTLKFLELTSESLDMAYGDPET